MDSLPNTYLFVDGSALLQDLKRIQGVEPFRDAKFSVSGFVDWFQDGLSHFHSGHYRRITFYFVKGDERPEQQIELPDPGRSGGSADVRIEWCGKSIRGESKKARKWCDLNAVPDYVRECLYRSEKAVDTQLCADALQLAAVNKLDRLFLYTNDFDFAPICRALRQIGINVNLIRLPGGSVNRDLAKECDGYNEAGRMHKLFPDAWRRAAEVGPCLDGLKALK